MRFVKLDLSLRAFQRRNSKYQEQKLNSVMKPCISRIFQVSLCAIFLHFMINNMSKEFAEAKFVLYSLKNRLIQH